MKPRDIEPLQAVLPLAEAQTVGAFIDRAMNTLARLAATELVSFNEMDTGSRIASVSLRPYEPGHSIAVDVVNSMLNEHPLFVWYITQPDWSARRLSDVITWEELIQTRLYDQVLRHVGGERMLAVLLTPPSTGRIVYFALNRSSPDFSDEELDAARCLQPALAALYWHLSRSGAAPSVAAPVLTRRERMILGFLADGQTAETIGRTTHASPATVRTHLQNIYTKLGTSDRLTAVLRARDLGLLREDELSSQFSWNIRSELPTTADPPAPQHNADTSRRR